MSESSSEKGKISFFAAVLMSINIMVGAGILYSVGPLTEAVGSTSFLAWPLIGILLFPIVWSIAKASQLFPGEGGFLNYCSKGISPLAGFIAQWGFFLGYMGTAASLATVFREGIIKNSGWEIFHSYPFLFNCVLVIFYVLINLIPLEKISRIQSSGTLLKITPIIMAIALLVPYFNPEISYNLSALSNIGVVVATVLFSFWGFETCCSIGGLLKDGPQKVGSVILVGFFTTVTLYFFFHIGVMYIMGVDNLAKYGAIEFPRFMGLSPALATGLQIGITGAILLSWANSILGASLANISNLNSLAKNQLLLGHQSLVAENRYQRPYNAAFVYGLIFLAFISFINDVGILFALTSLGIQVALFLTIVSVFRKQLALKNYTQVFVTILAFISSAALVYYSVAQIPNFWYAMPLIGGMAVGITLYKLQEAKGAVAAAS